MMEQPPFKRLQSHDSAVPPAPRRARLGDLDHHFHCSIIGTCLSTAELRRLMPRYAPLDREHASDLEIHHTAVQHASAGGEAAKALQKALDSRYESTLKQFKAAQSDAALRALWSAALDSGDIPGAYWALMTHPLTSIDLRERAFGEVHMLSHLVGAANRADIRRLQALERQSAGLQEHLEQQQARLTEVGAQRDAARRQVLEQARQLAARALQAARQTPQPEAGAELDRLQHAVQERDRRLALQTLRREEAEQRERQQLERNAELQARLGKLMAGYDAVHAEMRALEDALAASCEEPAGAHEEDALPGAARGRAFGARSRALHSLRGRRILYVGGRPSSNAVLRRLVGAAGGELSVHDGGIEDRKGLLAAALPGADLVVFPVDCVGHDAMNTLKRVCARQGVAYHPLRSASVASFVELISRLAAPQAPVAASVSRFCLKHG